MHKPATGTEAVRRLMRIDQLREFIHLGRASLRKLRAEGKYPYQPPYDVRTDYEYWRRLYVEKFGEEPPG